jgi:hypothetical protein
MGAGGGGYVDGDGFGGGAAANLLGDGQRWAVLGGDGDGGELSRRDGPWEED